MFDAVMILGSRMFLTSDTAITDQYKRQKKNLMNRWLRLGQSESGNSYNAYLFDFGLHGCLQSLSIQVLKLVRMIKINF